MKIRFSALPFVFPLVTVAMLSGVLSRPAAAETLTELDDAGNPIVETALEETFGVLGSHLDVNPIPAPNGTIRSTSFEWITPGAPATGNDFALRLNAYGGVDINYQFDTPNDLTIDFHWRHHSGTELAYMWNDRGSQSTGFRAFTNGTARTGLLFRNVFGGDDVRVTGDFHDGNWYHIRVVLDGSDETFTVYIDGVQKGQTYYDGSGFRSADAFRVMGADISTNAQIDYDRFVWVPAAIHDPEIVITSELLHYELEDGSGDVVTNGIPNQPPVADAGENQVVRCEGPEGAWVTLDGSASYDPDGDDLAFEWSVVEDSGIQIDDPTAEITDALFPLGGHEVTLTVYDLDEEGYRKGSFDVAWVSIIVFDDTPPVAMVTTDVAALWPPNNKMVPVAISVWASDYCTAPGDLLVICEITSSQPDDTDGTGEHVGDVDGEDGYSAPVEVELLNMGDGEYTALVFLRAERDGDDKAGRIYSVNVLAMDLSENVGEASTNVVVPHNQGGRKR